MVFRRKYNVTLSGAQLIRIPMTKAGSTDFAINTDWTPAAGDVKVSKDGGATANIGTLPSYNNGAWEFVLSGTELSAKNILVTIVDSATKAVDDNAFIVETYGHASAMWVPDLTNGTDMALTALADIYHAEIEFNRDQAGSVDEYTVTFFKNGVRLTGGFDSTPTLRVIKRSDGSDLFAAASMTQIASTGIYKLDRTTTSRLTLGESGIAEAVHVISSVSRPFTEIVGRDST